MIVIPAQAGIQPAVALAPNLDPGLRRDDNLLPIASTRSGRATTECRKDLFSKEPSAMGKWFLLGATLLCAWMLYDTLQMRTTVMKSTFEVIRHLWGSGTDHLTLNERESMRNYYSSWLGVGNFVMIFLAATVVLAIATIRAFLE